MSNPKYDKVIINRYNETLHHVDVYDVLAAYNVSNPALQHLIKKALNLGQRGHKDRLEDAQDIIDSALRAKDLEEQIHD